MIDTPSSSRRGPFVGLYGPGATLVQVWPLDPRPEDIHVATIGRGLGGEARYMNATRGFWSVAPHAVECSLAPMSDGSPAPPIEAWKRLHHDDSEPIFRDLARPLKRDPTMGLDVYLRADHRFMDRAIAPRFGLPPGFHDEPEVKYADDLVLRTEIRDLRQPRAWPPTDPQEYGPTLPHRLWPTTPHEAEIRWLRRFVELADLLGRVDDAAEGRAAIAHAEQEHAEMQRENGGNGRPSGIRNCVAAIAVDPSGARVCLIWSSKRQRWETPGGGMLDGETVEAAIRRELHEETGLVAREVGPIHVRHGQPVPGAAFRSVVFVARVTVVSDTLRAGSDAADARWFTPSEIPWADMSPLVSTDVLRENLASYPIGQSAA